MTLVETTHDSALGGERNSSGYFLVLCPPKAATTWVFDCLDADQRISLGKSKEIRYFSEHGDRGVDWYRRQFRKGTGVGPAVDVCHDYLQDAGAPGVADGIEEPLTALVVLRDPLTRTWSDYKHRIRQGRYDFTYPEALSKDAELLANSTYGDALTRWAAVVDQAQLPVLLFEEIKADPIAALEAIYTELSTPLPEALPSVVSERSNPARDSRWPAATRTLRDVGGVLQRRGLHRVVHHVKRSAILERTLYRSESQTDAAPSLRAAGDEIVREALRDDIITVSEVVGDRIERYWKP